MTERLEQRYCIKFCQKLGDSQAETVHKIQQAFGNDAMGFTQIKEWFKCFKHGLMSVDSEQLSGRSSTSQMIPQVCLAPCSRDMVPCDFWLFPILKTLLKGCRFHSRKDIIQNAMAQLHAIPKEAFQDCFQRWKDHWANCVESQGAYLEGDWVL
ncbi:hypothetical protein B7P43_G06664 [Cryptotermes secundus]|uniref:Mos1 transposase HTH domain-containing protein n=1 Tax=Cryptotermes secundus TaxID=105785 RepID=A0A2J7Q2D5_9NEOP|nr:hypothetical protein B7P43_G06664 [Cryptotermes secundus]